jgi:hypothetical protein
MVKVWVLMAFMSMLDGHGGNGGPIVIDNIATLSECNRLARNFLTVPHQDFHWTCTEVWKVSR